MRCVLAMILAFMPVMGQAQDLPKSVKAKINRDAQDYIDEVSVLIMGFGRDGVIDRAGLENVVSLARAEARALAYRRLQGADLDGDGAISGQEVQIAAAAASAVSRGRLLVYFGHADADGNGQVAVPEMQAYAEHVALDIVSAAKVQATMAVLALDQNGDGQVSVAEAGQAISALASAQRNAREIENQLRIQGDDNQGDQDGQGDQPARGDQLPHLDAVGREHDQGHHGEAEL